MTRTVATRPCSRTLHLRLLRGFMDQAVSLVLPGENSFRDGGRHRGFIQHVQADYRNFDLSNLNSTTLRSNIIIVYAGSIRKSARVRRRERSSLSLI